MAGKNDSRNKDNKHNDDDAVVTSAPAANVGNLLTDLLSSVTKDVEEERHQKVDVQATKREQEAKLQREREESRLRMAAQEKLIEENRLRNESLNKVREELEGEGGRAGLHATGQHVRPLEAAPVMLAPKAIEVSKVGPIPSRGVNRFLAAAMVVVGVGLGFGGAFATQPEQKAVFPDLDRAAATTFALVTKIAKDTVALQSEVTREAARVTELEGNVKTMQARQTELEEKIAGFAATAAGEDPKADAATEPDAKAPTTRRTKPRSNGTSLPGLSTGIY